MYKSLPDRLLRNIISEEISDYQRDEANVLRGVLPIEWVDVMREAVERILNNPGSASLEYTPEGKKGRYYGDFFIWRRDPAFKAFMKDSPMPELAAQVMDAQCLNFFYDQLLVKEPNTEEPTPWHQDLSYWPVRSNQVISVWVSFDPANVESGVVVYVKGSHKWGKLYAPHAFGDKSGFSEIYAKAGLEPLPDIEAKRRQYEILRWEMEPGDVLIHHPLTLHYASGNKSTTGRRRGLDINGNCEWISFLCLKPPNSVWDDTIFSKINPYPSIKSSLYFIESVVYNAFQIFNFRIRQSLKLALPSLLR